MARGGRRRGFLRETHRKITSPARIPVKPGTLRSCDTPPYRTGEKPMFSAIPWPRSLSVKAMNRATSPAGGPFV